ncbi:MAG: nitroreductase family protein [Deltaproteobacteria bacterium]|nr:nitroreductase family protein [Deltaproteobacteria bacterium]
MYFNELLEKRRSVRDFEDKNVPLDLIKEIINDSIKAPNASHKQPWSFLIVNNKDMMKRISDASKKTLIAGIEKDPNSPMKGYAEVLRDENFNVFYNAPCMVGIVGRIKGATIAYDCALLACYFMLSATARGLGTTWVAQGAEVRNPELLNEIGLSEGYRIHAPIILGYPKSIPPMPERKEPNILKTIS